MEEDDDDLDNNLASISSDLTRIESMQYVTSRPSSSTSIFNEEKLFNIRELFDKISLNTVFVYLNKK